MFTGANTWKTIITIIRLIQISDYGHVNRLSDAAQTHSGLVKPSHYISFLISVENILLFISLYVTIIKM